jgi:hypothetical protein
MRSMEPFLLKPRSSNPTSAPATFHAWLDLPDELKLKILSHLLDVSDTIEKHGHDRMLATNLRSIIGTRNSHLTTLALETYYKRNTFQATCSLTPVNSAEDGPDMYQRCFRYPPRVYGAQLRHLVIVDTHCEFRRSLEDALLPKRSAWRYLLKASRALDHSRYTLPPKPTGSLDTESWGAALPNLKTLELQLTLKFQIGFPLLPTRCIISSGRRLKLEKWLAETEPRFKAQKVEVQIRHTTAEKPFFVVCKHCQPSADLIARMSTKEE